MKLKYLLLSLAFFAGCDANLTLHDAGGSCGTDSDCKAPLVCANNTCTVSAVGSSSTGGSDGSADSGATASSGGTSTGSSDGGIITTSSSGGSSGGSSGSSSGGPPPKSHVNLINAAPNSTNNLDLCVKVDGDPADPAAGISGGIAYKSITPFFDVTPSAMTDIWVVDATAGDCSTPLGAGQQTVDTSNTDLLYTVVIYQNNTDDLTQLTFTVVPGRAPLTVTDANLEIVHALVTADSGTITFSSELPHNSSPPESIGTVSPGDAAAGETPALNAVALSVATGETAKSGPYEFAGLNAPANTVTTIVLVGNEDTAIPASLLLCNESAAAPTCDEIQPTPTGFLRFANLTDSGDDIATTFWLTSNALPPPFDFSAAIGVTLSGGQVSNFAAAAATGYAFCVTQNDTTPPTDCVGGTEVLVANATLNNGLYTTFAYSGVGALQHTELAAAPPVDGNPQVNTLVTTMNLLTDDTAFATNAALQAPDNFNFTLAAGMDNATPAVTDIGGTSNEPASLWYQLAGNALQVNSSLARVGFVFPAITSLQATNTSSYTALLGAKGSLMFCPNDGQGDNPGGIATCSVAAPRTVPATATGYLRVFDLSAAMSDGVDVCSDAGGVFISNVPFERGSAFLPVPAGTTQLKFAQSGTSCAGDAGTIYLSNYAFEPTAGGYDNLVFFGDTVPDIAVTRTLSTPFQTDPSSIAFSAGNAWLVGDGVNVDIDFNFDQGTPIKEVQLDGTGNIKPITDTYQEFALPVTNNTFEIDISGGDPAWASGFFDYAFDPALEWIGSTFTVIAYHEFGDAEANPPRFLICNDQLTTNMLPGGPVTCTVASGVPEL